MARTFHRKKSLDAMSEINVTPLIDLAFALLIIFIITTPLLEQTIAVTLPLETQKAQEQPDFDFQSISINADGDYFWGEDPISFEDLDVLLAELATRPNPPVLNIRADRTLQYQEVISLIDLIKTHNLTKISLDTQVK